jgi:hypothetical protein
MNVYHRGSTVKLFGGSLRGRIGDIMIKNEGRVVYEIIIVNGGSIDREWLTEDQFQVISGETNKIGFRS